MLCNGQFEMRSGLTVAQKHMVILVLQTFAEVHQAQAQVPISAVREIMFIVCRVHWQEHLVLL